MVDSREKGARAETAVKKALKDATGLGWERVPGSGALHEKHGLKGDLYVPNKENLYCIEVKHYAEDHVSTGLLTHKNPQIIDFWEQTVRESAQVGKKPLLIFKHDRSKLFAAYQDIPDADYRYMLVNILGHQFCISTLEDYLIHENPKFIK